MTGAIRVEWIADFARDRGPDCLPQAMVCAALMARRGQTISTEMLAVFCCGIKEIAEIIRFTANHDPYLTEEHRAIAYAGEYRHATDALIASRISAIELEMEKSGRGLEDAWTTIARQIFPFKTETAA